jgi:hypothetical protein
MYRGVFIEPLPGNALTCHSIIVGPPALLIMVDGSCHISEVFWEPASTLPMIP